MCWPRDKRDPSSLGAAQIWCTPGTFVNVTLTRYARPMRTMSVPFWRSRALENLTEECLRIYSRLEPPSTQLCQSESKSLQTLLLVDLLTRQRTMLHPRNTKAQKK